MNTKLYKDLAGELRLFSDKGEEQSVATDAMFEVCAALYVIGADIPEEWGYDPGANTDPRDEESHWYHYLDCYNEHELLEIGAFLNRYLSLIDKPGGTTKG